MSLLKHLEDEAHLLLQELQQHVINQVSKGNKVNEKLQELINHLESHVNPTSADSTSVPATSVVVDTPAAAPVVPAAVVEETVVVEAPQTVAQAQSASNKAN